jgi:hypothetical protein
MLNARTTREDGGLLWRCLPCPRLPLQPLREREARERLSRGEQPHAIARAMHTSVEVITALGRQPVVRREI